MSTSENGAGSFDATEIIASHVTEHEIIEAHDRIHPLSAKEIATLSGDEKTLLVAIRRLQRVDRKDLQAVTEYKWGWPRIKAALRSLEWKWLIHETLEPDGEWSKVVWKPGSIKNSLKNKKFIAFIERLSGGAA